MPRWLRGKAKRTGAGGASARGARPPRPLLRRAPGEILPSGQPDEAADAVDVGVQRHDERAAGHVPEAEVDSVRATDHPAQEEVEALARAAAAGMREEMLQTPGGATLPQQRREVGGAQLVDEVARPDAKRARRAPASGEECTERPVCARDAPRAVQQACHVAR